MHLYLCVTQYPLIFSNLRFDLPCHEIVYEDKGKLKKWNRLSKKQKHASTSCTNASKGSISAENSPVELLNQQINAGFLMHLEELKQFLLLEKSKFLEKFVVHTL